MPGNNGKTDKILVLVACSSRAEAERIAQALLDARLAACASIGPGVVSRYWWQGRLEEAAEVPLVLKSRRSLFDALATAVRRLHAYEVPEILALPVVAGTPAYLAWLDDNLSR